MGPIPLGGAVVNSAGDLPYRAIIHVAGINLVWRASVASIRDAARNALCLAVQHGFRSLALPAIGAGSGGFDEERALALIADEVGRSPPLLDVVLVRYRPGQRV